MAVESVSLTLTSDEALVLFDLLHRWEDNHEISPPEHQGEQVALWNLSALLESALIEPLDQDYPRLVTEARANLAGRP